MMESFGALVGWTHHDAGDRILLRLESVQSSEAAKTHDPDLFRCLMTKQKPRFWAIISCGFRASAQHLLVAIGELHR